MNRQKFLAITHTLFQIAVFIALATLIVSIITSRTNVLGGLRSFTIVSGSMEPNIPLGSIVFTVPTNDYSPGDIVAFTDKTGRTVDHRIAKMTSQNNSTIITTRGDANNSPDSDKLATSNVIGKNVFQIPYVGRLSEILKTLPGFILLLGVPLFVFVLFELKNIKNEIEKEIDKRVTAKTSSDQVAFHEI